MDQEGWKNIDNLLCKCYDRSYSHVMTFHVNLCLTDVEVEDDELMEDSELMGGDELMVYVQNAWPKFWEKGIVNIASQPLLENFW